MKILLLLFLSFVTSFASNKQKINFSDYFNDQTMRIDYYHTGNAKFDLITLDKIYTYGIWAGSTTNLIDAFNNGAYYAKIYDMISDSLIYSKGFNSYYFEYQTSTDAIRGKKKTFQESILIPTPKEKIKLVFEKRSRENKLEQLAEFIIDPESVDVIRKKISGDNIKIIHGKLNGSPHNKVDIAILSEGYTKTEYNKFKNDFNRFMNVFLNKEPYKKVNDKFNFYGVFKPSAESGVDEPRAGKYKSTVLSCTFNSLGSARYLLTEDNKAMRNLAEHVPYDAIYIMVNSKRYGGGGIYNQFCTFTTNNKWSKYIFLHEFGHSFTGLADEYYTSDVAYSDFYPQSVEPVEPNITALLNKPHVKWDSLLTPGIVIPTPWGKEKYDSLDLSWQRLRRKLNNQIAKLTKQNAPRDSITIIKNMFNKLDKEHSAKIDSFLHKSKYAGKVGAFEGAGYASKGLYRPMLDCIMFSKGDKPFCNVCASAIKSMINFYSK